MVAFLPKQHFILILGTCHFQ